MATPTVHNPTHFEPKDYEVLDYLDNRRPAYYGQTIGELETEIQWWEADMLRTYGASWRSKIGRCVHCGNGNVRWITATKHLPTGDIVTFGADCTDRLGFANKVAFKLALLQKKAAGVAGRLKVWKAREAFLVANPAIKAAIEQVKGNAVHAKNSFVQDVLSKLDKYGSLSVPQVNAVINSLQRDIEFAARKAAQAVEPKGNAPSGKATVTGEVLSIKEYAGYAYGTYTYKMLVKLTNNSRVFLTAPAGVERGDTVTFSATFEPKADDLSFAFGKRPRLVAEPKKKAPAVAPEPVELPAIELPAAQAAAELYEHIASLDLGPKGLLEIAAALEGK